MRSDARPWQATSSKASFNSPEPISSRRLGMRLPPKNLVRSGLLRLQHTPDHYMGIDTATFAENVTLWMHNHGRAWVRIRLEGCANARSVSRSS